MASLSRKALDATAGPPSLLQSSTRARGKIDLAWQLALLTADLTAVCLTASMAVLGWLALGHPLSPAFYASLWPLAALFAAAYASAGLYTSIALHPAEELRRLTVATSLVCLSLSAMTFLAKEGTAYSRAVFLLTWLGALVSVPVLRALVRHAAGPRAWWGQSAVIVGDPEHGARLLEQLRAKPSLGLKPVAVAEPALARLYREQLGVRCAILTAASFRDPLELAAWLGELQQVFSRVILVPAVSGVPTLGVHSTDLNGILGLEMSHRLLRPSSVRVKQVSDIVLAALVTVAALPLLAAIALAVRATSPGPVFFAHARRGRGGRVFTAWKFRTMVADADAVLARHLSENEEARREWEAAQKLGRDPRVTPVGRWLRRYSLDELPQLWNVLRREMSLVGPRPIIDAEIARYGQGYALYQRVLPGLTGLWQVSGRNRLPYEERVKLDLYYVTNWSLWLDLYILARTARAVLQGEGAS